jgi:phosphoribosyl-ATP pyrophosphohydrolase/phosphoribosyl-AMP cyclohydrolase
MEKMDKTVKSSADKSAILEEIYRVIIERKKLKPEDSYVAKKMSEGIDRILKKVGEEAGEVIIAAKNGNPEEIGWEMADLIFHMWLVLGYFDLSPDIIYDNLISRRK